jgi:hypothetical protein
MLRLALTGEPVRWLAPDAGAAHSPLVGVDVTPLVLDGHAHTVVQVLLDDDRPGFDPSLLDGPIVAEVFDPAGSLLVREPLDHDRFRRRLQSERHAGESVARGILVLPGGQLPPPWVRLAFLPFEIGSTGGCSLALRRTSVEELVEGVEQAFSAGRIAEGERRSLLSSIEHLHPALDH